MIPWLRGGLVVLLLLLGYSLPAELFIFFGVG